MLSPKIILASDFSLKCDEKKCTPASITSFFDGQVLWYPTYSANNTVTITNKGKISQFIGHRAYNIKTSPDVDIAEVLDLTIVRKSVNQTVWKSTLREFYDTSEAVLGLLGPGKTDSFEYTVTMNGNAGNEYQGQYTQFDMLFGYFIPTVTPTPSNTPTPTPTPTSTPTPPVQGIVIPQPIQRIISRLSNSISPPNRQQAPVFALRPPAGAPRVLGTQSSTSTINFIILGLLIIAFVVLLLLLIIWRRRQ